jgi:uncharacterized coiled-coil DUF342 family protein
MPRKTIASLEHQVEKLRELRDFDTREKHRLMGEVAQLKQRIQQISAENEEYRSNVKWFKSLIQNLVTGGKDALPR